MSYLLPNRTAGSRLELLAELYDPWTQRHIEALGLAPGWRVWEVGAGGPSVPAWLAARGAQVLATDIDASQLPAGTFEVRVHDVAADPPPGDGFDLVHARLVLTHVPARERALANMVAALRPGGWLLVEDADPGLQPLATFDTGAAAERANRMRRAFRARLEERGADLAFGRRLPAMLRAAGLRAIASDAYIAIAQPACALLERATIAVLRDQLDEPAAEIDAHLAAVAAGEIAVAQPALVSAWGART